MHDGGFLNGSMAPTYVGTYGHLNGWYTQTYRCLSGLYDQSMSSLFTIVLHLLPCLFFCHFEYIVSPGCVNNFTI